nr:MAG TPA: hypothetical protein [Caudoviricetes sp.]
MRISRILLVQPVKNNRRNYPEYRNKKKEENNDMAIEIKEFVGKDNMKTIKEENLSKSQTRRIKIIKEAQKNKKKTGENKKNA